MSKVFKKYISILVTVFTLGLITPADIFPDIFQPENSTKQSRSESTMPQFHDADLPMLDASEELSAQVESSPYFLWDKLAWKELSGHIEDREELSKQFKAYMVYQADLQASRKFGEHIDLRVGKQYREAILPQFAKVLKDMSQTADEELLRHVAVTDRPASGLGERIVHLYDSRDGADIVRFHVRREKPPQQGYWFSFHYHLQDDGFEKHHELGKIYWDKNTPPRWVS